MKRIFVIDWILVPAFALSAWSGFELHAAGWGDNHEIWHNWAVFHVMTSFLFFVFTVLHVTTHWKWYRGAARNGMGKKSKVTATLSVLFLFVSITGFALLGIEGANSAVGLCHYAIGIITSIISTGHILKRIPALRKSFG